MRQIAVVEGEMLEVLKRGLNGWWTGRKQGGSIGFFPQDCVSASPPKLDAIGDNSGGCAKAVRGGQQRREISVGGCGNAEGVGIREPDAVDGDEGGGGRDDGGGIVGRTIGRK
jgi:hypothetical protein